jgi:hypothetical protein
VSATSLNSRFLLSIASYAFSQGCIFLAFTWLVLQGETALLGRVGLGLGYLVLGMGLGDWGGLSLLGKYFLNGSLRRDLPQIDRSRLTASTCVAGATLALGFATSDAFVSAMLIAGAPAVLLWGLNLTGAIEALPRARGARLVQGIPFILAGASIPLLPRIENLHVAGAAIGCAFTVGALTAVILQRLFFRATPDADFPPLSNKEAGSYARNGAWNIFSFLPGQFYGAGCLWLVAQTLSFEVAGLFVYARAVVVFATQLVTIGSRVYSVRLVAVLALPRYRFLTIIGQFKEVLIFSVLLGLMISGCAWLLKDALSQGRIAETLYWTSIYALIIPLTALGMITFQVCVMATKDVPYAIVNLISILVGFIVFFAAIGPIGLMAYMAGELTQVLIRVGWAGSSLSKGTKHV